MYSRHCRRWSASNLAFLNNLTRRGRALVYTSQKSLKEEVSRDEEFISRNILSVRCFPPLPNESGLLSTREKLTTPTRPLPAKAVKDLTDGWPRKIDSNSPNIYTRKMYDALFRNRAYLLTHLCTSHTWLPTYAKAVLLGLAICDYQYS